MESTKFDFLVFSRVVYAYEVYLLYEQGHVYLVQATLWKKNPVFLYFNFPPVQEYRKYKMEFSNIILMT